MAIKYESGGVEKGRNSSKKEYHNLCKFSFKIEVKRAEEYASYVMDTTKKKKKKRKTNKQRRKRLCSILQMFSIETIL